MSSAVLNLLFMCLLWSVLLIIIVVVAVVSIVVVVVVLWLVLQARPGMFNSCFLALSFLPFAVVLAERLLLLSPLSTLLTPLN